MMKEAPGIIQSQTVRLSRMNVTESCKGLIVATPYEIIKGASLSFWELNAQMGESIVLALIGKILMSAAKLVSVTQNLTLPQSVEASKDILYEYGDLKPDELKYLLKRNLRTKALYSRFDYNIIMRWIEEYMDEHIRLVQEISEQESSLIIDELPDDSSAMPMSYETWLESLLTRAETDPAAAELRDSILNRPDYRPRQSCSREEKQKFLDFKKEYLKDKAQRLTILRQEMD